MDAQQPLAELVLEGLERLFDQDLGLAVVDGDVFVFGQQV